MGGRQLGGRRCEIPACGFPFELFHLFGLTILLGTTVLLSLRLLGVVMRKQPLPELARDFAPGRVEHGGGADLGHLHVFLGGSPVLRQRSPFRIKMVLLFTALIFHFVYFRRVVRRDENSLSPAATKLAGIGALVLWFGVGLAGRSIGFVG